MAGVDGFDPKQKHHYVVPQYSKLVSKANFHAHQIRDIIDHKQESSTLKDLLK